MKKIATLFLMLGIFLPLGVSAQSSEQVLAELMDLLAGKSTVPAPSPASVSASSTMPAAAAASQAKTSTTAEPAVLPPFYLFDIDGNKPKVDPNIAAMQSAVNSLMLQLAAITSAMPAVATSTATTTPATTSAPVAPPRFVFKKDLKLGSRGAEVKELQLILIARKLLFGEPTGYFGILTQTALVTFQEELGLPGVGTVGPKTRAVLNALPAERFTSEPPALYPFGVPSTPRISSSTSMSFASSTTGSSTIPVGSSTPMFDYFAPPVSVTMTLLPTEAPVGGSTAVTWIAENATSCEASDGWSGMKSTIGAARIEPLQFSLNFVLTCTGPGGIASTTALVVVGDEQ